MTTTHDPQRPYGPRHTGRRRALIVAAAVAAGLVALACANPSTDDPAQSQQDASNRAAATATSAAAPTAQTTTAAPTKTSPAPVTLTNGVYTIGEDAPAGRYKVTERAPADCYWSRTKGQDIIDNGLGGGFPSFTTKTGETVEIMGCPDFARLAK